MVKQILTVHIGGAGIRIGQKVWEILIREHGIDEMGYFNGNSDNQITGIDTFFTETPCKYIPRAMFMDAMVCAPNNIVASRMGQLYDPRNFLINHVPAENHFGGYHAPDGEHLVGRYLSLMRKHVEMCDSFQGFQITHGLAGGTGCGMTSLVLEETKSELPTKHLYCYCVLPPKTAGDIVVQSYNSILGIHRLIESADTVITFHNASVCKLWDNFFYTHPIPSYANINAIIANSIGGIAAPLRHECSSDLNFRTITNNLVPYPRLHFLMSCHVPIGDTNIQDLNRIADYGEWKGSSSAKKLNQGIYNTGNGSLWLSDYAPEGGTFLTMGQFYRGHIDQAVLDLCIANSEIAQKHRYVDWIPNHVLSCTVPNDPSSRHEISLTCIANSTIIHHAFMDLSVQFETMFNYGGFLHIFERRGIPPEQLAASHNYMTDVAEEYILYHNEKITSEDKKKVDRAEKLAKEEKDRTMSLDEREDLFLA